MKKWVLGRRGKMDSRFRGKKEIQMEKRGKEGMDSRLRGNDGRGRE